MRPINVPFSDRHTFDALDEQARIPKLGGVYVWTVQYWPLPPRCLYVGRAGTSLRERCLGKFGAHEGTSDYYLIERAMKHRRRGAIVRLHCYPLPKWDPWINHIEARLIRDLYEPKFTYNTRHESINPWLYPFDVLLVFIESTIEGAGAGVGLMIVCFLAYTSLKFLRLV